MRSGGTAERRRSNAAMRRRGNGAAGFSVGTADEARSAAHRIGLSQETTRRRVAGSATYDFAGLAVDCL